MAKFCIAPRGHSPALAPRRADRGTHLGDRRSLRAFRLRIDLPEIRRVGVSLSASAPQRPAEAAPYPAVHDIPPPRNSVTLTSTEKVQMESDLVGARNEQQQTVAKPEKKKDQKAQPQGRVIPASSRASIY